MANTGDLDQFHRTKAMAAIGRREFIMRLGGAAVAWPIAARAQQSDRMRRIGMLMSIAPTDPQADARIKAIERALQELGWIDGRNVRIDYRWGMSDAKATVKFAAELVALAPDVILANSSPATAALQQATRTVPIVFVQVSDPVGGGFVENLARPGGNITGFSSFDYEMSGKWLALLKEIAPSVSRVAIIRDPTIAAGAGQLGAIQALAPSLGVQLTPIGVRDPAEIQRAIDAFVRQPKGGLVVTPSAFASINRDLIIALAARHRLPAIYPYRFYITSGGLMSYGFDNINLWRLAASYVDRILKGAKPADLPVQAPTKYELVINLKTAKALGLIVPPTLLARADEVIE